MDISKLCSVATRAISGTSDTNLSMSITQLEKWEFFEN